VRTTDDFGRWGGASGQKPAAELSVLNRARRLFADLSRGLQGEIDRLKALLADETGATGIQSLTKMIRMNQKALQSVLDKEAELVGRTEGAPAGREVIDFAEARAEIARRLARLRK
jgi:hypothetical protein